MYHSCSFLILISDFLIIIFPGFIGATPFSSILELLKDIIFLFSGILLFISVPSSPSGFLSFFTLILLIPLPSSLIRYFYGAPVGPAGTSIFGRTISPGVGGFFSPDSPLEATRVRLMLSFILLLPMECNDA
jgi:hypothetical protein